MSPSRSSYDQQPVNPPETPAWSSPASSTTSTATDRRPERAGAAVLAAVLTASTVTATAIHWSWFGIGVFGLLLPCLAMALVRVGPNGSAGAPWTSLVAGVALVTLSSPAVLTQVVGALAPSTSALTTPTAPEGQILLISAGVLIVVFPVIFRSNLQLLHRRRAEVVPAADPWFDGLGSLLALLAVEAALLVPALTTAGLDATQAWTGLIRVAVLMVLWSFAVANCQIIGWRADRRLVKVMIVMALLVGAEGIDLAGSVTGTGWTQAVAAGLRAGALSLLLAAAWRPPVRPSVSAGSIRAAMVSPVSIFTMAMTAVFFLAVAHVGNPLPVLTLITAALMIVALKVASLGQSMILLLEGKRLSLTDELTGLPNRRAFFETVINAVDQGAMSVMLLDLDGFKKVNDTFGHALGDRLLQDSAQRLDAIVAAPAVVARLGGDEFAVFVPAGHPVEATVMAESIAHALGPRQVAGQDVQVSVSIGVAGSGTRSGRGADDPAWAARGRRAHVRGATGSARKGDRGRKDEDGSQSRQHVEALLHAADVAMYQAKARGGGWQRATELPQDIPCPRSSEQPRTS